jgi:hypothetical protein
LFGRQIGRRAENPGKYGIFRDIPDGDRTMSSEHKDVDNLKATRPFWLPADTDLEDLPEGLRAVLDGVLAPAYKELVLGARPGVEQGAGLTVVGMLWLELLEYFELGRYSSSQGGNPDQDKKEKSISRLLRLAGAKLKASDFLLRLREARRRWAKEAGVLNKTASGDIKVTD